MTTPIIPANQYNSFDIIMNNILSCNDTCNNSSVTITSDMLALPNNVVTMLSSSNITTLPQLVDAITGAVGVDETINYIQIFYYVSGNGSVGKNNCNYNLNVNTSYSSGGSFTVQVASSGTSAGNISSGWIPAISSTNPMNLIIIKIGSSSGTGDSGCLFDTSGNWNMSISLKINVVVDIEALCNTSFANGIGYDVCKKYFSPPAPQQSPTNMPPSINGPINIPPGVDGPINKPPSINGPINRPPSKQPPVAPPAAPTVDSSSFFSKYWWLVLIIFVIIVTLIFFVIFIVNKNSKTKKSTGKIMANTLITKNLMKSFL